MAAATDRVPLVTVGIPVYQGERYLPETIESARTQDHPRLEILISDNGSTDGTEEICRAAAAADERVRYLRYDHNRGGTWNYNNLISEARGEMLTITAADDVKLPTFVSSCVAALEAAGDGCILAVSRTRIIDENGDVTEDLGDENLVIDEPTPHERMAHFMRTVASHIMYGVVRTDALRATRGLRPVAGGDVVILAELACLGWFTLVPEQSFLQRKHPGAHSATRAGYDAFYRPQGHSRFSFPHTRLQADLLLACVIAPVSVAERARCLRTSITHWVIPQWRGPAGDLREALGVIRRPGRPGA